MTTNEMPERPSDEDFAAVRDWLASRIYTTSVMERKGRGVLRYLLAQYDARHAPVAVPRNVLSWARAVADARLSGCPSTTEMAADWILSLVPEPEPVVEWEPRVDSDGNTHWLGRIGGKSVIDVVHCLRSGRPTYRIEYGGAKEYECDLAAAKSRAEELCGISSKKGG